jgi:hypothetical protein
MNIAKALSTAILISTAIMMSSVAYASNNLNGRGSPGSPIVYVESQGLFYDSIVLADLPQQGRFQELVPGMNGLSTEFGPGDVGHLGGRWWIDLNMDGIMDSSDKYFLCPLLGPGRESP